MGGFARFTSIRYLILQTSCFKIIVAICCFTGPQMDSTSYFWAGPKTSASVNLSSLSHTPVSVVEAGGRENVGVP